MDYIVGSVAALISGNVTPNRPRIVKKALTPIKHQPSPNVTPKSELVDDRSIFLSPSLQKKKAIVKKSPKRIFQNPDLDESELAEGQSTNSPKADKVKKHLKGDLEKEDTVSKQDELLTSPSFKKKKNDTLIANIQANNESTPKKKKQLNSTAESVLNTLDEKTDEGAKTVANIKRKSPKKKLDLSHIDNTEAVVNNDDITKSKKRNKKKKNKTNNSENLKIAHKENDIKTAELDNTGLKRKNKKGKKLKQVNQVEAVETEDTKDQEEDIENQETKQKSKKRKYNDLVNPNAVTNEDSDSEHDSDDDVESEDEQINNEILDTGPVEDSSDEEEEKKEQEKKTEKKVEPREVVNDKEEIKRTLFVGNVPFSSKCKKEIKKMFFKYGDIETVRIRTVPVKDARVTPKLAVIKKELHPERSTVNVYVKFKDASSVAEALAENNTVLNGNHLRVSRSDVSGAEHDPLCSVFVGNLPFGLEDEVLRQKFENCGEIVSVRIIRDKKTNAGKGFGYVNFASKDGVELALGLSDEDLTIKNRILRVKRSTPGAQKQKTQLKGNFRGRNQAVGRSQGGHNPSFGRNQGGNNQNFGRNQDKPQFGRNQGNPQFGRNRGGGNQSFGRNQMGRNQSGGGNQAFGRNQGGRNQGEEGAYRRIMNKRTHQENGEGPPNKRPKGVNEPHKEKKNRKEFVGMTAEKKKKQKFNKGQKKKKAISEILTKH